MLNSKTKKRIAINKLARSQPWKRVEVLIKRAQEMPSASSFLSVKHMPNAEQLRGTYTAAVEALYQKWDAEDKLYYGRARRRQELARHSSKTKKKAQSEMWRNMEPRDAVAFVITNKGVKRDLKEHTYLDTLNALSN
jgi:hypothetical protein